MSITQLQPHQQRVVIERDQLSDAANKLSVFINDDEKFQPLDEAEKARMIKQNSLQHQLVVVLNERIAYFSHVNSISKS